MTKAEVLSQRLGKVRAAMVERDVDALILQRDEKIASVDTFYLSGFTGTTGFLVIRQDDAVFITDSRYTQQARQELHRIAVVEAVRRDQVYGELIPQALGDARRVGFMQREVLAEFYLNLQKHLPGKEIIPLRSIVETIRAVKDSLEVRKIRRSIRATENALRSAFASVRPGVSELEVLEVFKAALPKGSALAFDPIIASGVRSVLPHSRASDKIIEDGDVVQFDLGILLDRYVSDLSRVVICGKASPEQIRMHRALVHSIDEALKFFRPGVKAAESHTRALEVLESFGYADSKFGHALGHGIGLNGHEAPHVSTGANPVPVFESGHVATIEPGIYSKELGFGMRIELDVLITPDGHEILDRLPWRRLVETDKLIRRR